MPAPSPNPLRLREPLDCCHAEGAGRLAGASQGYDGGMSTIQWAGLSDPPSP